jgi:hypothetical protein
MIDAASHRDMSVVSLQLLLLTRGYDPGPIDGIRGSRTVAAERAASIKSGWLGWPVGFREVLAWLRDQPRVGVQVPRVLTPLSAAEIREALTVGHFDAFDVYPSASRLRMACAQMHVEHVSIIEGIYNFNLGHITTGRGYLGPWFSMTSDEQGKNHKLHAHNWCASADAAEGALLYWSNLKNTCPDALASFARDDPTHAASQLKTGGYRTAQHVDYARLLTLAWRAS